MTNLPPVLYRGSVKNVRGEVSAKNLVFEFSDRYSVFDWGEMPDQLDGKGKSLALMGKSFFQFLENPLNWKNLFSSQILLRAFSHDYLNALKSSDLYKSYAQNGLPHHMVSEAVDIDSPYMKVTNVEVLRPPFDEKSYDYKAFLQRPLNSLVPLEIIFRIGLPLGNSLSKRLGNDMTKWKALGFEKIHECGLLKIPFIDFSTKLEKGDRYLDSQEAQAISGMSDIEWAKLNQMTHLIALNLFNFHHELGLELIDGKIEVAFTDSDNGTRDFMLVDSIGIDELRLLYKGKSFSKEFLREAYKDSEWFNFLEMSKKEAHFKNLDFKTICLEHYRSGPGPLATHVIERAEAVYKCYANAVTQKVFGQYYFPKNFNLENYSKRYM